MALTVTPTVRHVYSIGDRKEAIIDIATNAAAQTGSGGDAITAASLGFDVIDVFQPIGLASDATGTAAYGVVVLYPATAYATSVNIAYVNQVTAGATTPMGLATGTLTAVGFRARVVGKGKVAGVVS